MQEQERLANEEAEKRLKAALTAKREPTTAASRMASPSIGNSSNADIQADSKPAIQESSAIEDASMEAEPTSVAVSPPSPEASFCFDLTSKKADNI